MKKGIFGLLLLPLLMGQAPRPQFYLLGAGNGSCARAFDGVINEQLSLAWSVGYMSGRNSIGGGMVGRSTDIDGVIGEVKLYCQTHPSEILYRAVDAIYEKLRDKP